MSKERASTGRSTSIPGIVVDPYLPVSKVAIVTHRVGISQEEFFESFMPWNEKTSDKYRSAQPPSDATIILSSMSGSAENVMYTIYCNALKDWVEGRTACDPSQDHIIKNAFGGWGKPNTCTDITFEAVNTGHHEPSQLPAWDKSEYSLMQTYTEIKATADEDPFVSPGLRNRTPEEYPPKNPSTRATNIWGQMASNVALTLQSSRRTHLFTVAIFGKYCRFIRWDGRGAIVTRLFDYTEEPETVFHFYHRFAQLTDAERGFDPIITMPGQASKEARNSEGCFSNYSEGMRCCDGTADAAADPKMKSNLMCLKPTVVFDIVKQSFTIPSPCFYLNRLSPFSRSTRRTLVYGPAVGENGTSKVLFMKEYWREDSDRTTSEDQVYKLLTEKGGNEQVAEMNIVGDALGLKICWQETALGGFSQCPASETSDYGVLHRHHLILRTIAIATDVTVFLNARWLVTCIADAMTAAQEAFLKAGVLHQDISVRNIIIVIKDNGEKRGVLIDWDHCIILRDTQSPSRMLRTGTWQFMSARLLEGGDNTRSTLDDQESAYWVLLYIALRYLKHSLSAGRLSHELHKLFDLAMRDTNGRISGGDEKSKHLGYADRFEKIHFDIPQLVKMFNELADGLSAPYLLEPLDHEVQTYNILIQTLGEDSPSVRFSPAGKVYAARRNSSDQEWFIKTLRKHAANIPLPKDLKNSDYHLNLILEDPLLWRWWGCRKALPGQNFRFSSR